MQEKLVLQMYQCLGLENEQPDDFFLQMFIDFPYAITVQRRLSETRIPHLHKFC